MGKGTPYPFSFIPTLSYPFLFTPKPFTSDGDKDQLCTPITQPPTYISFSIKPWHSNNALLDNFWKFPLCKKSTPYDHPIVEPYISIRSNDAKSEMKIPMLYWVTDIQHYNFTFLLKFGILISQINLKDQ
jgi:hypothetical protein